MIQAEPFLIDPKTNTPSGLAVNDGALRPLSVRLVFSAAVALSIGLVSGAFDAPAQQHFNIACTSLDGTTYTKKSTGTDNMPAEFANRKAPFIHFANATGGVFIAKLLCNFSKAAP